MENKLKEVIQNQGRTQKWVAEQLGVKEDTFGQWCRNKRKFDTDMLKRIAELLNVKMEDLI